MPLKNVTKATATGVDDLQEAAKKATSDLIAQLKNDIETGTANGKTRLLFPDGIDLIHVIVETALAKVEVKVAGSKSAKLVAADSMEKED